MSVTNEDLVRECHKKPGVKLTSKLKGLETDLLAANTLLTEAESIIDCLLCAPLANVTDWKARVAAHIAKTGIDPESKD